MTIKSLLLGSAAALVAVTGARAADAVVVAEPEPVEYVRVCDAYGAGYFYIPGTETCLRMEGYVWYQIGTETYDGAGSSPDYLTYGAYPDEEGWIKSTRARVQFDMRSQTEWGQLGGRIRLQADWGGAVGPNPFNDGPVGIDQAYLDFGGFRAGYTESAWDEAKYGGVSSWGSHSWGGMSYGYLQRHQLGYTFGAEEGFSATFSLEDDALAGDGYIPDAVGVFSYNQSWGGVWAKVGYDNSLGNLPNEIEDTGSGWGASAGLQWNVPNSPGSSLRVIGYYSSADVIYGVGAPYMAITGGNGAAEWSALVSYYQQFSETFGASVGGQYFSNFYEAFSEDKTGVSGYEAEVAVVWTPVTNFEIRSEVYYDKYEDLDGSVSGFLRFTRFF